MRINPLLWEFSNIYRRHKTLQRFMQISFKVLKFMLRLLFGRLFGWIIPKRLNPAGGDIWGRVRRLIEDLGPTFIKFGQILSTRTEIPPALRDELKKLLEAVPPFSYQEVNDIIEEELAAPIEELFVSFEKEPIAAASLAQVHRAWLREGEGPPVEVAVKIQRPDLEAIVQLDLAVLETVIRIIHKSMKRIRLFNLPEIIDAFGTALNREVDFVLEGRSCDRLAKINKNDPTVKIPKVYWDYTTKRIITLEFIGGIQISHLDELDRAGMDRHDIALHMTRAYMEQIFAEGFLHADPHPGNLYILDDEVIAFLDFGMVEYIDDKLLTDLTELLVALVHDNTGPRVAEEFMNIHTGNKWEVDYPKLVLGMSTFIDRHFVDGKMPLAQKGVGYIMNELVYEAIKHGIKLPQPLLLVIKTLLYVEALASELYPGFDVLDMLQPHVNRRLRRKLYAKLAPFDLRHPVELADDLAEATEYAADFAKDIPRRLTVIADKIERGELEFRTREVGGEHHSNQTLFNILIIALIIGLIIVVVIKL